MQLLETGLADAVSAAVRALERILAFSSIHDLDPPGFAEIQALDSILKDALPGLRYPELSSPTGKEVGPGGAGGGDRARLFRVLLCLLRHGPHAVVVAAVGVLAEHACRAENRPRIVAAGLLPMLVRLLGDAGQGPPSRRAARCNAAETIMRLAEEDECAEGDEDAGGDEGEVRARLVDAGVLPPLVRLLEFGEAAESAAAGDALWVRT